MAMPVGRTRIQERNRATILDAALEVFSQFGFRGATLDLIADSAGLSKPNLLYYFASKEAIYTELLGTLMTTWLDPLRALDDIGDPRAEILDYVHRKLQMSREFPARKPPVRQRDPARRAAHRSGAGWRVEGPGR